MKQRSGLHKKISSIFDGVPLPGSGTRGAENNLRPDGNGSKNAEPKAPAYFGKPAAPAPQVKQETPKPEPVQKTISQNEQKPQSQQPSVENSVPEKQPRQPMPKSIAMEKHAQPPKPKSSLLEKQPQQPSHKSGVPEKQPKQAAKQAKKAAPVKTRKQASGGMFDSLRKTLKEGGEEARQAKMKLLVGLLTPIFLIVIFAMLYQPKKSIAKSDADTSVANITQKPSWQFEWTAPPEYPQELRDPMKIVSIGNSNADGSDPGMNLEGLVVKGIVFSKTRPTAIIGDSIVSEGEKVGGVTVVKINRDSVELEKDGKTWTLEVQH